MDLFSCHLITQSEHFWWGKTRIKRQRTKYGIRKMWMLFLDWYNRVCCLFHRQMSCTSKGHVSRADSPSVLCNILLQSYHINFLKQSLSFKVQLLVMQDLKRQSSWKMKGNFAINFISALATLWETDNFGVGSSSLSEFGVLDTTLAYRNMLRLILFFLMQVLLLEEFLGKSSSCGTQTWWWIQQGATKGTDYVFYSREGLQT